MENTDRILLIRDTQIDYVIYHDKCPDGIAAAWSFRKELGRYSFDEIGCKFIGAIHGQDPPLDICNKTIAIVDFCFPKTVLIEMASKAKKIIVLDHHESARKDLEGDDLPQNIEAIFDMKRSGAQIAWDYVYPYKSRPWFIEIIADRDLWKWEIRHSKALGKALLMAGYYTFEKLGELYGRGFSIDFQKLINEGETFLELEEKEIRNICSKAVLTCFNPSSGKQGGGDDGSGRRYRVQLVSCPHNLVSEVGHRLCESDDTIDFAAMWNYDFINDEWRISCRAVKDDINLAEICSKFKRGAGGGHKKAAGFTIFGYEHSYEMKDKEGDRYIKTISGEKLHTYFTDMSLAEFLAY